MFFQYKVNKLRIYLFEDKLKMNNWNRLFINILKYKFIVEFINEKENLSKNKYWFIFEVWNYISCKDILEINNLENYLEI